MSILNTLKVAFTSKKFLVSFGGLLMVTLNEALGWGMTPETQTKLVAIVVAYVLGQGIADTQKKPK